MENKRILVTGHKGFLCSHLIERLSPSNNIIRFGGDVRQSRIYTSIDAIIHFASPSERKDFKDREKTATTIVDGTLNLLQIAKHNRAKFIFASTVGVSFAAPNVNKIYESSKLGMDTYIQSVYNDYVILRIPRVYGSERSKGLIRVLRENLVPEEDMEQELDYLTVDQFVDQTLPALDQTNVVHEYHALRTETIRQIKDRFIA
jgi:nucleoside-diphosphate-sugar epimerase